MVQNPERGLAPVHLARRSALKARPCPCGRARARNSDCTAPSRALRQSFRNSLSVCPDGRWLLLLARLRGRMASRGTRMGRARHDQGIEVLYPPQCWSRVMLEYEREHISITVYAATSDANPKKSWSGACRCTDACSVKKEKKYMQQAARILQPHI